MRIKYSKVNKLPEIDVFGYVNNNSCIFAGTEDLPDEKRLMRALLTEDKAASRGDICSAEAEVYEENFLPILLVAKENITLSVEFIGGNKSPIEVEFANVYVSKASDLVEVFLYQGECPVELSKLNSAREGMAAAHPECCNRYKVVDSKGNRVVVRLYKRIG